MSGAMQMMHVPLFGAVRAGPPAQLLGPLLHSASGPGLELTCAILLALGLFTQPASLGLLLAGAITQTSDSQLLVCVLIAWYLVSGAGPFSLDHALSGLASSALTPARAFLRAAAWLRSTTLPVYQVLLRAGLAAALLLPNAVGRGMQVFLSELVRPPMMPFASTLPSLVAIIAAVLLLAGAATRYLAILLLLGAGLEAMLNQNWGTELYWAFALGLAVLRGPGVLSVDTVIERWLRRTYPELDGRPSFSLEGLPRVVIVGAGFGGLIWSDPCQAPISLSHGFRAPKFEPLRINSARDTRRESRSWRR